MIIDKYIPLNFFSIREPRYHDKMVLLASRKVGEHNKVIFTHASSMGAHPYYVSGKVVKKCKLGSNGAIPCYEVPLSKLESLTVSDRSIHEIS